MEPHTLQGSLSEKIQKVIKNTLGNTRIEARQLERVKHNEGVRHRNEEKRERAAYKQFKEEKKKEAERKEAFDKLSSYEKRLVQDPHYFHPRKIQKGKLKKKPNLILTPLQEM